MNQQVRKIIKSSFCAKDKWVPDSDAKNCFKCDKSFHPLFRRKHHCRSCGQVFCSQCSDFFIPGKDLGQQQKNVRMCQICYQKCWKYIVKHDQQYKQFRKSRDSKQDSLPQNIQELQLQKSQGMNEQDKLKQIQSIIQEYGTKDQGAIKNLKQQVDKKFKILLQVILKQGGISLKYLIKIYEIAKKIHQCVPPNAMISQNMNICSNLRIKCFHRDCNQVDFELSQGTLLKKLFKSKKVKQQYENISCVLVYGGIQAQDLLFQKQVSFQNMVANRLKQMNNLIRACENLKINMIFAQGGIEKQFQDMLFQKSIAVISRVKVDTLVKIKNTLEIATIVQSISKLYTHTHEDIVGKIQKMTSMSQIAIKQGNQTKKFFYIPSSKPELGLTLFLRSNDHNLLLKIKKQLKFILLLIRHMNLKMYKVLLDQSLLDSMKEQKKNECYLKNSQIFFNLYSQYHSDILNYLKERYLTYKQITYVESNFTNYPEVSKQGLDQYLNGRIHSFSNKWNHFTEICGKIKDQHQIYYSEDDTPMGAYILKKLTGSNQKCYQCGKPNYAHIQMFYSTDQYVQMWTESRIIQSAIQQDEGQIKVVNGQSDLIMVFESLHQQTQKKKLSCHIQCNDCQEMISEKKYLAKEHLEFSFLAFMNHMFKGSIQTKIRQNNKKKPKKSNNVCYHGKKVRVFQLGDKSLKIYVGKYTINRQCLMTPSGRQFYLKKKSEKFSLQKCLLQTNKIQRIGMFMLDQIKSIAQSSKISNIDSMIKNPKSSFMKVRTTIIGNVKLSQAQCVDMILPQVIDELSKLNNIAVLLLNYKRVKDYLHACKIVHAFVNLLKRIYTVIIQIKKSIKKRDLDMKFNANDFNDEYFMEEIDINSVLDASSIQQSQQTEKTRSQISKGDNYSTVNKDDIQTMDNNNNVNYQWLQPQQEKPIQTRFDRKTQYNFNARKSNKCSEEQTIRYFKQFSSILRVQHAFFDYIPTYPHHSQLLISSALNSQIHKQCIQKSDQFKTQLKVVMNSFLETDIQLDFEQLNKISGMISVHQRRFGIQEKLKKSPSINYEITLLYPNQFQILRRKKEIPLELFINSVGGAENWITSGGKSGCSFMRSYNDLFVIKRINQRQFLSFARMLKDYFTHLHGGSLLAPIYGAFVVSRNNNSQYFIVMQNLFFGMKDWYLYDFKGSVTRRFSKPPIIPLDVNMLIDRNSQPIFCKQNVLKNLNSTLDFLVKNNVVDYSLILVVQIENTEDYYLDGNRFQIGIVDYMREFGAGEYVQRLWKGSQGTVQQPIHYKQRMQKKLKNYFTQIPL